MTTGFAGPYDLVAAIVMAILAACMGISIHPAVAGVVSPYLGCAPDHCRGPCGVDRVPAGILRDPGCRSLTRTCMGRRRTAETLAVAR
jgi:hypothetical protein